MQIYWHAIVDVQAGELRSFQCASCAIGMSLKFSDHRFVSVL